MPLYWELEFQHWNFGWTQTFSQWQEAFVHHCLDHDDGRGKGKVRPDLRQEDSLGLVKLRKDNQERVKGKIFASIRRKVF